MNIRNCILALFMIISLSSFSQKYYITKNSTFYNALDIYTPDNKPSLSDNLNSYMQTKLFPEFTEGYISLLSEDTVRNLKIQYDCSSHQILTSIKGKYANGYYSIASIVYVGTANALLFNPTNVGFKPIKHKEIIEGLVEITSTTDDRDFIIGKFYNAYFQRSDYNPILQTGDKEDKYVVEVDRYLFHKGKYYRLPNSNKKIRNLLKENLDMEINNKTNLLDDTILTQELNAY